MALRNFVSPLPRDYTNRTLLRLLPPSDAVSGMNREQVVRMLALKQELTELIERDPVRFFQPHEHGGQREFMECRDPRVRVLMYLAGNKGGKTTAGAIRAAEYAAGGPLWGHDHRNFTTPTPSRGVVFSEDFDSHAEITLPALHAWLPRGLVKQYHRNPAGHVTRIECANESVIFLRTYDQGSEKAEGKDWDWIWFDEPPPRDVYIAARRGIVSTNGIAFLTATLVKEGWVYDELEFDYVRAFEGSMDDNEWLDAEARRTFLDSLTEEERLVRQFGKPIHMTGLVFKEFVNAPPYVIEDRPLNPEYPIIMGVDPHERRPVHVEWAYLTPENRIVWFDWALIRGAGSLKELFDELRIRHSEMPHKPVLVVMDPRRGQTPQMGGPTWKDAFEDAGYEVTLGTMERIKVGHAMLHDLLSPPTPRMVWTEACRGRGGPIWQMMRYAWRDPISRKDADADDTPKERAKDFPDIHRYVACAGLEYDALREGYRIVDYTPEGWRGRQRLACVA